MDMAGAPANSRRRDLQLQWDQAFRDFESATFEFSASVKRVRNEMDALRAPGAKQHTDAL